MVEIVQERGEVCHLLSYEDQEDAPKIVSGSMVSHWSHLI